MIRLMFLIIVAAQVLSCGNYECFINQVGEYQFDVEKTMGQSDRLKRYYELDSLKKFRIVFKEDSTFHTNMQVDFFYDTIGTWESGTCGFENPGIMKYYTSPVKEQFGTCHKGDSFCAKIGPYNRGGITLWFRKVKF